MCVPAFQSILPLKVNKGNLFSVREKPANAHKTVFNQLMHIKFCFDFQQYIFLRLLFVKGTSANNNKMD